MTTLDDFIAFYESVPDSKWCNGMGDGDAACAIGHLCERGRDGFSIETPAVHKLEKLLTTDRIGLYSLALVNDGRNARYQQPHPKLRVLAFLNDLKAERANQP
jgi:hypothetical protein